MQHDRTAAANGHLGDGELVEVVLRLDARAPGTARELVARCLVGRVAPSALDCGRLLVTELVTNSLHHARTPQGEIVVSVELMPDWFRVGVQDQGSDAVVEVRPADMEAGGGFGLNLVEMLSERWGVERLADGGTQVWAQVARTEGAHHPSGNGSGRPAPGT
jgi:anti-sigma regulatory factor (Ser/Thr protein kinase)